MVDLKGLKHVPWSKLVVVAAMAIVPAILSYCKASQETDDARTLSRREADAGYQTLVTSVKHLEQVVSMQQDAIRALFLQSAPTFGAIPDAGVPEAAPVDAGGGEFAVTVPSVPTPNLKPFPELPANTQAALRMQTEQMAQ